MGSTIANIPGSVSITNNLGYDVDIYDVYTSNSKATPSGPTIYTKLGTVPNGATGQQVTTFRPSSQLQPMRTGYIKELNNTYYEQFPVTVLSSLSYMSLAFTLTSDMQQGMVESFKFIKYTQANPSSPLAAGFRKAATDPTGQTDAVNKFFKRFTNFQHCDLTTWTAVMGWMAEFTNAWQGTYYLYSVDNSTAGSTAPPALVATLAITASPAANSAVVTMSGSGEENTSIVMVGDGSMQEEDAGTGNISVALTPVWLNITQTSNQNGSSPTIGVAFTGTISGVKVAGNPNKMNIPSSSDTSSADSGPNSAAWGYMNDVEGILGMLATVGMLAYQIKDSKQAEKQRERDAQKDATSEQDAKEKASPVKKEYQETDVPNLATGADNADNLAAKVPNAYKRVGQSQAIMIDEEVFHVEENKILELVKGQPPGDDMEVVGTDMQNLDNNLGNAMNAGANTDEREKILNNVDNNITSVDKAVDKTVADQGNEISEIERREIANSDKVVDAEKKQINDIKEDEEEQKKEQAKEGEEEKDAEGNHGADDEDGELHGK